MEQCGDELVAQRAGELAGTIRTDSDAVTLTLTGTADAEAESGLGELLGRVHAESQRAGAPEVVVDLRQLEFMNSSCFRSFITWFTALRRLPPEQHYRITVRASAAMHWQSRSLPALRHFGGELVELRVE